MHWKRGLTLTASVLGPLAPLVVSVLMAFPSADVRAQSVSLIGDWKLSTSADEGLGAFEVDDSTWATTRLPGNPNVAFPSKHHWLRRTFEWSGSTTDPSFLVLGNLRNGLVELFVNGSSVGRSESSNARYQPDHAALVGVEVRPGVLRPGTNVVALSITWHELEASGLIDPAMLLGPEHLVRPYFVRYRTQNQLFSYGSLFMCLLLMVLLGAMSFATGDARARVRFRAALWVISTVALYEALVTGVITLVVPLPLKQWAAVAMFTMAMLTDGVHTYIESEFFDRASRWQVAKKIITVLCVAATLYDSRAVRLVTVYSGVMIFYMIAIVTRATLRKPEPLVMVLTVSVYGLAGTALISLASNFGLVAWPDTFPQALANFGIIAASTLVVEFIDISRTNQLLSASLQVTNTDLASALSKAQESTRVKSELLASVSHELRTPLNAIVNIPEGLLEDFPVSQHCSQCDVALTQVGPCTACGAQNTVDHVDYIGSPADTARYLKRVCGSGRHLLSVVNDILDYSRMNAGRFPLTLGTVGIASLFETLKETAEPLAHEKQLTLTCSHLAPTDTLRGDAVRLRQVLFNLVSNAIKFSEPGGKVEVTATEEGQHWCFAVRDEGIGIAEEHQKTIFESFRQVDGGSTRRFGGTGLGLSIARELVTMHDGALTVQSALGHGSTFSFRVPKAGPATREAPVRATINESRSILIVDDNPTTLETMKLALRPLGAVLVGTTDPRGALAMVRELKPDLLVLDVLMPHITGIDLLRLLRESRDTKHLPVLVTSAHHDSEHAARALGAQWLPRPWNNAELTQLTASLLEEASHRPAAAHLAVQEWRTTLER